MSSGHFPINRNPATSTECQFTSQPDLAYQKNLGDLEVDPGTSSHFHSMSACGEGDTTGAETQVSAVTRDAAGLPVQPESTEWQAE